MKSLWTGALLVAGQSFYDPKFILVFSVIIFIELIIGRRMYLRKLVILLKNKQQLLSLKRSSTGIEEEVDTCYLNISKHNKDKSS